MSVDMRKDDVVPSIARHWRTLTVILEINLMYMNVMEDQIFCSMFLSAVVQISSLCCTNQMSKSRCWKIKLLYKLD